MTVAEQGHLRMESNGAARPSPRTFHLAARVFAQAERTPDAAAVTFGHEQLTYHELVRRADRLAHRLREWGVGPDVPVALALERSLDLPVAVLAVLAAGGAYVPIDPNYPADRVAFMLGDCGATILVTQATVRLPVHSLRTILLDRDSFEPEPGSNGFADTPGPDHLGYIIYTSGSTGRPKGVAMRRGALDNLIDWQLGVSAMGPGDVTLQFASLSFDVSFQEFFSTWCSGGTLAIVPEPLRYDPVGLLRFIDEQQVARLFLPVVMLQQLAEAAAAASRYPDELREVITAGEALQITPAVADFFTHLPRCRLHNHYGPSETHVVTAHVLTGPPAEWPAQPPIGRPIDNAIILITDADLKPVPAGQTGELLIGGACLARGYVNQPEMTAERFIPISDFRFQSVNGQDKSAIFYRTGDLARLRPDGEIEFLGRADQQVKIRGFRVEPGEVETALCRHPGVRAAAVVAREDVPGDRRLIAYIVAKVSPIPPADDLRNFLTTSLPEYMIPSSFVPIDQLPQTPSGKLDRRALPVPPRERPALQSTFALPRTPTEEMVAKIWRDVLGIDRVGIDDRFADLGGHSLAAARVHVVLQKALGRSFPIVVLFQHATIRELATCLAGETKSASADRIQSPAADPAVGVIAVVGMAGRFPGAVDIGQFWRNLCDGVESITVFNDQELLAAGGNPALVSRPDYIKARGVLPDADRFDAGFFGFQPREAELLDPQHRVFLETCWTALEHAGYDPGRYPGNVGVYAGSSFNTYLLANICSSRAVIDDLVDGYQVTGFPTLLGNAQDYLPTRVSYKLNLRGPSMAVQTACSTSLVAVCQASDALLAGQCDMALAGGVSISFPQRRGYLYSEGAMVSPDGHCRAFDAEAAGTVFGEGAGVVVLKRLADAVRDRDTIYAVVKGTAVNNDGSDKLSYLATSVDGQATAIRKALTRAGVDAGSIRYVEAHGTGTPLGDSIEVAALTHAFRTDGAAAGYCALGSVKPNVGHLEAASGVTGLIKTVLALHHDRLPPTLHYNRPNPRIDFVASPFRVVDRLGNWPTGSGPRRAGVSSLGAGGTNAHVVLEEAPPPAPTDAGKARQLLLLSARTAPALETVTRNLADYLREQPELPLADVAFTLQVGRRPFEHRRMIVCRDAADAVAALDDPARIVAARAEVADPPVAFLFPGQGAQFVRMAVETYAAEPAFRQALDGCAETLRPHVGIDIRSTLYPSPETVAEASARLRQTAITQPALFAVEYALAQLWMSWGVRPAAMFGHSAGEFVAACLAGVFSLDDALMLVALRGRLAQNLAPGSMLAVRLSEADVLPLLGPDLSLAAVTGPAQCVISGPTEAVAALQKRLTEQAIVCRLLATSHAFHSPMVEPILDRFAAGVAGVKRNPPAIPFLSCVSGNWIKPEQAIDPAYWSAQLRQTVRCADALRILTADRRVLLEAGPGRTLANLARQQAAAPPLLIVSALPRPEADDAETATLLGAVGRLWLAGVTIDWNQFHAPARRPRVPLPTYPFERQRYWIEPPSRSSEGPPTVAEQPPTLVPSVGDESAQTERPPALPRLRTLFAELSGVGADRLDPRASFFELGFDSLFLTQAVLEIQNRFGVRVSFRQLLEDLSSLDALAAYLDRYRPASEIKSPVNGETASTASPSEPAREFEVPNATAVAGECRVPSTESQRGLWLASQMSATASCAFNETCAFRLRGPLDQNALRQAVQALADRHESLRSVFDATGEYQVIRTALAAEVSVNDLTTLAPAERERAAAALVEAADGEPFDLQAGPLWRLQLVALAADDHMLLLVIHHLICDGWSYDILLQELGALYGAALSGRPHGLPEPSRFSDYAREQAALVRDGRARSRAFWLAKYESLPPILELPSDRTRGPLAKGYGARLIEPLGTELTARMKVAAGRLGCTPYATLLATFQALLQRLTGATDLVVGVPVAGQAVSGKQKLVGRCTNFLPLRQTVDPDQPFERLAAAAKRTLLDGYEFQDFSYVGLMQELQISRGVNRPLVSVSFNIDPQLRLPAFAGLTCDARKTPKHFVSVDLNLNLVDTGADYTTEWEYDCTLCSEETSRGWMELFRIYLAEVVARPDILVRELSAPPRRSVVTSPAATTDARDRVTPSTDAEKELLKVWADVLGVPDLSVADSFFDRGGHSLLAARLVAEVRRRLGHEVPLSAFYTAPTVATMARMIETRLEAGTERSLVPLCETGRRPPLFLIAGIGGHVFAFHQFARLLGPDQPTYAFKAIGVDGRREPLDRIEGIAAEYVRDILEARPDGPYVVGGYSIGATVALEVVLQLRTLGKKAPLLLAFDMTAPGYPPDRSLPGKVWFHGRNLLLGRNRLAYLRDRYRSMARRFRRLLGREILDAPHIEGVEAFPQEALKRVWVGLETAHRRYRPLSHFDGGVALFRATDLDEWAAQTWLDPQLGWQAWADGPIESFSAAAAHTELFHESNIVQLAEQVGGRIKRLTPGP